VFVIVVYEFSTIGVCLHWPDVDMCHWICVELLLESKFCYIGAGFDMILADACRSRCLLTLFL